MYYIIEFESPEVINDSKLWRIHCDRASGQLLVLRIIFLVTFFRKKELGALVAASHQEKNDTNELCYVKMCRCSQQSVVKTKHERR